MATVRVELSDDGEMDVAVDGCDNEAAALMCIAAAQRLHQGVTIPSDADPRAVWLKVSVVPPRLVVVGARQPEQGQFRIESSINDKIGQCELLLDALHIVFKHGKAEVINLLNNVMSQGVKPIKSDRVN